MCVCVAEDSDSDVEPISSSTAKTVATPAKPPAKKVAVAVEVQVATIAAPFGDTMDALEDSLYDDSISEEWKVKRATIARKPSALR